MPWSTFLLSNGPKVVPACRRMVDLFSGAGGLSLGLIDAGFESVLAIDSDPYACRTYELNIGRAHREDLSTLSAQFIWDTAAIGEGDLDVVCGGPPCQGFSTQRRGNAQDRRNDLVVSFARLAVELRPAIIIIENVPGLLGVRGVSEYRQICEIMSLSRYLTKAKVLNAADYGVPQQRTRAFVVAWDPNRSGDFNFPVATQNPATTCTVRAAIGDLPEPPSDYSEHPDFPNHIRVRISALNERRIAHVPPGGGRLDIPPELQLPCHSKDNGHRHLDVYGRLQWDQPAGTITAMFDNFTRGRFAHPEHNRSITAREGARLQSFPDTFKFVGPKKDVARQIGNAVPPRLGRMLGEQVIAALERREIISGQRTLDFALQAVQRPAI